MIQAIVNKIRNTRKLRLAAAFSFAALGYVILNYPYLVVAILYRLAANDPASAIHNALSYGVQFALVCATLILLPKRWSTFLLMLFAVSALVNRGYFDILQTNLDSTGILWLLTELRQAQSAFIEFLPVLLVSTLKVALAIGCLLAARALFAGPPPAARRARAASPATIAAVLALTVGFDAAASYSGTGRGSEFNLFGLTARALAQTYPARAAVALRPAAPPKAEKIVWLIDESVAFTGFESVSGKLLANLPSDIDVINFGQATSFANCSAPSNAALRWGVNVAKIGARTDLRTAPSIWAYARAAGYRTTLIDGQVRGSPQNMIWDPERALIDTYLPASNGIETDREIAQKINQVLRSDKKEFIYVVLRGAHYQYHSNYPAHALPEGAALIDRYHKAIEYSKTGVFKSIFDSIPHNNVAVFYTSDHGQVIRAGALPHCSAKPPAEEYAVPLLLFAPANSWAAKFSGAAKSGHSHSQIFPTTLWLLGYSDSFAEANFDNLLDKQPQSIVKFGKSIVPGADGATIDVTVARPVASPGRPLRVSGAPVVGKPGTLRD
jgi:hypothetical protein